MTFDEKEHRIMIVIKKALPRRTFLRGTGVTIALPLLDAMVPALTATVRTAAKPARRFGCFYLGNGVIKQEWTPAQAGRAFQLPPSLTPLAKLQDRLVVVSGLAHLEANSKGDGNQDHDRASAVWLSGVHAWATADGTSGEIRLGTTADQIVATEFRNETSLPSIEIALERTMQSACDAGDCFFRSTISWRTPTTPLPMETHPRVVFERLFGDGGSAAARRAQTRKTGLVLDLVNEEIAQLRTTLGSSDRSKLDEYLEAVRDVERNIQVAENRDDDALELPERPTDVPETFEDHAAMMFDLLVLAFQADITRVFSVLLAREGSGLAFPQIGVPEQHHALSHHLDNPALMAKKAKIDRHMVSQYARFAERLAAIPDGDGSLLDHSLLLLGGGMGNGNLHEHTNLPCLLLGRSGGTLKGGRHLQYAANTPMSNLLLSVIDKLGVPLPDKIGDSTGRLPEL